MRTTGKTHFVVGKNFKHLLPSVVQKKIEKLYQVLLTVKEKDAAGQWIELEGEPVDQRNAMSYCHAICNPEETAMVRLSGPLYDTSIERIESQTNAVIKQVSVSGLYRIGGSKSSMALALSILDDIQSSGIFGTPARTQLATDELSVGGSTRNVVDSSAQKRKAPNLKQTAPTDLGSDMQPPFRSTDEAAGVSACKRKTPDTTLKLKEKAGDTQIPKLKEKSETLSNSGRKETDIPATEGKQIDNNSGDAKQLPDKSTESQLVISVEQDKKEKRKMKKKLSGKFKSGEEHGEHSKDGRDLPQAGTVLSKDPVDEAEVSEHVEQLTKELPAAQEDRNDNGQQSAVFTAACETALPVLNELSTLNHDLSFSSISFTEEPSKSFTRPRKTSKASKRLSISLVSILNSSNARMDNCLEAPDTVKRAIISCLESEQDKKIDNIDDSVILVDNDEDEGQCLDVSHIVISDDEDDDDNNITIVNLDDTVVEVNNNDLAFDDIEKVAADNNDAGVDDFTSLKKSVVSYTDSESDENKDPSKRTEEVVSNTNLVKEQTTETVQEADNQSSHRSVLNKITDKKRQPLNAKPRRKNDIETEDKTTGASAGMKRNSNNETDTKIKDSKKKKTEKKERTTEAPARYRTPYVNRNSKEKSKRKLQSVSVETKKKKRKKLKLPRHSTNDTDKYSKRVEEVDECRTPEVTNTSNKGRMIVPRTPITPYLVGLNSQGSRKLRYIVIDGSNVAMAHGNGKVFSCRGILIAVDYFRRRGHDLITVFLPQWRKCRQGNPNLMVDQHILDKLEREGDLVFTPSRRIERKLIASYDDRFIIELAEREEGVVVSNDNFRDLMMEKYSWRRVIKERLLMYSFVRDHFMLPEDPLGRYGPTLEKFLQH